MPGWEFVPGKRYRLTLLPIDARTRTVEREWRYLGISSLSDDMHLFDGRPEMGTQQVWDHQIKAAVEI